MAKRESTAQRGWLSRLRPRMAGCGLALATLLRPSISHGQAPSAIYPLDPLSRDEILATEAILMKAGKMHPATRVGTISLHEPAKTEVLASVRSGRPGPRAAGVLLYDWGAGVTSTGVVDLVRREVVSWTDLPPADPPNPGIIVARCTEIARSDARFQKAMRRRGYTDLSRLRIVPGTIADVYALPQRNGDRVDSAIVFDQDAVDYGASRAVDAIALWLNLTRGTVDSMADTLSGLVLTPHPRAVPARLALRSAAPTSRYRIDGTAIQWGRWRLRAAVDPRRGLELYDIGFKDKGTVRSILYRASISEMIAPYGDPGFFSWFPMDEADAGLGIYGMTSAMPGEDAPASASYLPAVFASDRGTTADLPRAIAVFERESAVQWRHGLAAGRARELVVRGYCTADNYDYVFDWIFREDGSIQVQVSLTGIVNAHDSPAQHDSGTTPDSHPMYSHLVAPGTAAPIHQHFFSYRLDFDIDRPDHNRVIELTASSAPAGPDNPGGQYFSVQGRPIETEQDAIRDRAAPSWRQWRVISTRDTNALGQPTGYALIPAEYTMPLSSPTSAPRRTAGFVSHEMWVTPYAPDEMYAAGEAPRRDTSAKGLPQWTAANRPVDDRDVVLWYTLGITHFPRTEDWPVMPAYTVGFRLVPSGFFSHDPALDTASTAVRAP